MINRELFITRLSAWAPGVENPGEWDEWAQGIRQISSGTKGPQISFADPMLRRRMSQISKMTVQVIHDLMPLKEGTKVFFVSFRGEISRHFQLNKMLIEEKSLMPAAFSLSVFNAPVALASITLGLRGGYTALYPTENNPFATCLAAAKAALLGSTAEEIAFVYADEEAPPEYGTELSLPTAFGLVLSEHQQCESPCSFPVPLSSVEGGEDAPLDFLRRILLCGKIHVSA